MTSRNVAIGELFHVGSSKRVLKSQWKNEGVPFYRGREITRLAADGFVDNELFISESDYAEYAAKYGVPGPGDIVITAIGTIGNSYIVQEGDRFYFKDASVLWLKKGTTVSSEFINLWLKSPQFFDQLDKGNGATVDTLTIKKVRSVLVDLPPLPEQERIVAILDEAFVAIATATANAEKNLANAREVFESVRDDLLCEPQAATDGTLGDEVDLLPGFAFKSAGYTDAADGMALLRGDNIVPGSLRWDGVKRWPKEDTAGYSRFELLAGDVVLAMDRPWINSGLKRAYITESDLPLLLVQRVARLRCLSDLDSRYLFHLISGRAFIRHILGEQTGVGVPHISGRRIQSFMFAKPRQNRQREIARKLDRIDRQTCSLSAAYAHKIDCLAELKQSLLHRAFTGELTADSNAVDRTLSEAGA